MKDFTKLLAGYYSSIYFEKSQTIARQFAPNVRVLVQYFQRHDDAVLCGIDEIVAFLKAVLKDSPETLRVFALQDGDIIQNCEPVLQIEGPYHEFGHFEGIFDGLLARQTSIASNCRRVVEAAQGKTVVYMGDRADHYLMLEDDGYAARIGGIKIQTVPAQIARHDGTITGTLPHALIQLFNGDLVKTMEYYAVTFPGQPLVALVDFNNDVITDSLKVARRFGEKLYAVRIDTAKNLCDKFFANKDRKEYGVNVTLVQNLRWALDKENFHHVKIIVSSGFDAQRIQEFEAQNAPVDIYGVGASLLQIGNHFTCDSVLRDGKPLAKVGRKFINSSRLKQVI